ncbi:hypothetical protein [Azospirillum argentinense]
MDDSESFRDILNKALSMIDSILAQENRALHERPLIASIEFVSLCIEKVRYKDQDEFEPGEFADYLDSDWFKAIFLKTQSWYSSRYGEAINTSRDSGIEGVTVIYNTPFLLKIPTTTVEAGTPGETVWICFHDALQPEEDVLGWIVNGPNLSAASKSDGIKLRRLSVEVANRLRSIKIHLMEITETDARVAEFRREIIPHLERAAQQIVRGKATDYKRAHWDIQMACEFAFKLLSQQRSGSFQQTHDLFFLYDHMPGDALPLKRTHLSKVPSWERMAEWRYGGGPIVSLDETFRCYRAALQIIDETLAAAKRRFRFGKAKFHTRKPPWMSKPDNSD